MQPWLQAWARGVPDFATYVDLANRRNQALAFYQNNDPGPLPETDEQRLVYAKRLAAYKQRARTDHLFLQMLRSISQCFTVPQVADLSQRLGLFDGYENWWRMVSPEVRARLDEARAAAMPAFGDAEALQAIARLKELAADAGRARAELVGQGFAILDRLIADEPRAEIAAAFADSLDDAAQRTHLAGAPGRLQKIRAALEAGLARQLRKVTPSPESSGREKEIAATLLARREGLEHARATSPLAKGAGRDGETVVIDGVKHAHTAATEFEGFDVEIVRREEPSRWRDLPGVAAADLCAITYATARRYTKGFDGKIKGWVVVDPSPAYPILCSAR
jgi:hypothetical protein